MTDSQKLDLLLSGMQEMKLDIHLLKDDVQTLKDDVQTLKDDVQTLKDDVQTLKDDVQTLKDDVQILTDDVRILKDDVRTLYQEVDIIKTKVTQLSLTVENDIRPSIQRVAEGHLDLSRNLHEAMKPSLEMEMLSLKVHMLEVDMRDVKAKLA